jgi:two-component system chemotaxis sensor kinase CheA
MSGLLEQFVIEGRELVQQATDDLLALERDPTDATRLDSAFRAVHTLKGSVGLFDLLPMGLALHAAEDLLEAVRSGGLGMDRGVVDALLGAIAATEAWIEAVAHAGALPGDAAERARLLEAALRAPLSAGRPPEKAAPPRRPDWLPALVLRQSAVVAAAQAAGRTVTALRYRPAPDCFFLGDDPLALVRAVPELAALEVAPREPWPEAGLDVFTCNLDILLLSTGGIEEVRRVFRFVADQVEVAELAQAAAIPEEKAAIGAADRASRSLRVDAARIDALLDLVGELVIAKNRLSHLVAEAGIADPRLARLLGDNQAAIERLTEAMHRAVTEVRMVPLSRTFGRFPRLVRETAARLGKAVRLEVDGGATEADKAVVDGLFEPLLHLLRNAVDHGIEDAAARAAAGKPAEGRVSLSARRVGDGLVIDVADDGGGIDAARLRRVAKARRLMPDAAVDALDDAAAAELVFLPGFSTAASVTSVSGRGVGMDAVRTAVEALGGRVALLGTPGRGSTVRIAVPQGPAATKLLILRVGEQRLGVPIEVIAETARIAAERILPLRDGEAFALRDRTVPLLKLARLLGVAAAPRGGSAHVVITGAGEARVGLEVDGFLGRTDVLLRPLEGLLAGMPGMLGTALLGDGQVLMVLDLPGLVQ